MLFVKFAPNYNENGTGRNLDFALMLGLQLGAREVIDIDNGWRFFYQYEGSSDHAQTVNLPHTWSIDALNGKQDYFRGVGNYMKELQIPKSWEGKQIYIRFGGAGTVTDLIVNGGMSGNTGADMVLSFSI